MPSLRKSVIASFFALSAACGDDDPSPSLDASVNTPVGSVGSDAGGTDASSFDASAQRSAYVLPIIIFGPDRNDVTYVSVVDSLDVKSVDTKKGLEFGGQADVAVFGGKVYISDGQAPIVGRYTVSADNKLVKEAEVSFAQFGVESVSVDDTVNTFVSATKAYMLGGDGSTVVWNPSEMTIVKSIPPNEQLVVTDETLTLSASSGYARGNRLYRVFSWINWMTYAYAPQQFVVVYDTDNDSVLSVTQESRCPALGALITGDESGTAYLSNWFYNVPSTLQNGAAKSCALRIKPGSDAVDPDWELDFNALSGGHEGAQVSYTSKGQALFGIFHEESAPPTTADTSPYDLISSENWEVWTVDVASKQAKAVTGIGRLGAQQNVFTLNGRTFLFAPNQDYSTTKVYEVKDGAGTPAFEIQGWSRAFVKVE